MLIFGHFFPIVLQINQSFTNAICNQIVKDTLVCHCPYLLQKFFYKASTRKQRYGQPTAKLNKNGILRNEEKNNYISETPTAVLIYICIYIHIHLPHQKCSAMFTKLFFLLSLQLNRYTYLLFIFRSEYMWLLWKLFEQICTTYYHLISVCRTVSLYEGMQIIVHRQVCFRW